MAESTHDGTTNGAAAEAEAETEEEDYMGDLSRFLPLETSNSVNPSSKKVNFMPCLVSNERKKKIL